MRKLITVLFLFLSACSLAQQAPKKWLRAFPITDYVVDLNDSLKLVQVKLPAENVLAEKQIGLLRGVYDKAHSDTALIGVGRCNLIKGEYYYFSINNRESGIKPKENDLLYCFVDTPKVYIGPIIKLATHNIGIQNVQGEELFDRSSIFLQWEKRDEQKLIDTLVKDIQFTGKYFLDANPSMNQKLSGSKYAGNMLFATMINCTKADLEDFFDYIIARPRLYAGRAWKISEIFATWLTNGAPVPVRN